MEIVGVVSKHLHAIQSDQLVTRLFVPLAQGYDGETFLHVRLNTKDRQAVVAMIPTLRQALQEIDPDLPLLQMTPFVDLMQKSPNLWIVGLGAKLFGAFGIIALLLAVVGVYGVKAYSVARRTREIGIRMALGAEGKMVLWMILREGFAMVAAGLILGFLLAFAAGKILSSILFEVSSTDPFAFTIAPVVLLSAALLATWLPARRATKISPMAALRTE